MEKQSSGRKPSAKPPQPPSKLPREKLFGANALQLSDKEAFKLVGSIVEKGISGDQPMAISSSTPPPSVLPFPVARHRSHGPHWGPEVEEADGDDKEDNDDETDTMNYNPIAQFAKPIKKKKKKGLDLSNWRDFAPSNSSPDALKKETKKSFPSYLEKKKVNAVDMEVSCEESMSDNLPIAREMNVEPHLEPLQSLSNTERKLRSDADSGYMDPTNALELDGFSDPSSMTNLIEDCVKLGNGEAEHNSASASMDCESEVGNDLKSETTSLLDGAMEKGRSTSGQETKVYERESSTIKPYAHAAKTPDFVSLESQIDAENRALLQRMSPDEIAEAQGEIRAKINPQLLNKLKARGKEKLEKNSTTTFGGAASDETRLPGRKNVEHSPVLDRNTTASSVAAVEKDMQTRLGENATQILCPGGDSWDAWSKRVEAVRNLRFSLYGNVMQTESLHSTTSVLGVRNNLDNYTADNVGERDFLRTEGDPAAAGYTIKEALALTRSVIPGQRALALHLLSSVLNNALQNILQGHTGYIVKDSDNVKNFVDWEAVWAFALGPEPELVLSLRLSLDDNHDSVVLACAKAIQCVLAYDWNEQFFDISDKLDPLEKHLYTAPVFRSKPDVRGGFLHGGFWKYSAKASNILDGNMIESKAEGEPTIQDDNIIAGQDVAAGLVRMGILPRLCYLLETNPTVALEECILSILIALARHSPTCADAILKCERLLKTVQDRFMLKNKLEDQACKVKSVKLVRVLAQSNYRNCSEFVKNGTFERMTWQLYQGPSSLNVLICAGKEHCKLLSLSMVEQLRFWKVCIMYGHCVSYFTYFFPAICLWLNPPAVKELIEKHILQEFASIAGEVYLVLGALAEKLPNWNTAENLNADTCDDTESWCWNDAASVVDIALKWISTGTDSPLYMLFDKENRVEYHFLSRGWAKSLLWVISAVVHMFSTIIIRATPLNLPNPNTTGKGQLLLDLVAKIGLPVINCDFLSFAGSGVLGHSTETNVGGSFIEKLCQLRHHTDHVTSLASVCCLHGVLRLAASIDHLFDLAKNQFLVLSFEGRELSKEERILDAGILKCSLDEWKWVLCEFMKSFNSVNHILHNIEVFGRGGPAPGVGIGWGVSGGGFWSSAVTLVQADARLLVDLLPIFQASSMKYLSRYEDEAFTIQTINSTLALCLSLGPRDKVIAEKAFEILLQVPILKHLSLCLPDFLHGEGGKRFMWEYKEKDLVHFSNILTSHFRDRWLCRKRKKPKAQDEIRSLRHKRWETSNSLATIDEEMDTMTMKLEDSASLAVEWTHQRLPLPSHWLLSPIATIGDGMISDATSTSDGDAFIQNSVDSLEVAKAGLFFLSGVEAVSSNLLDSNHSPVRSISLVWKLHSLSVALFSGVGVLEDERSRDVYEALQRLYGQHLDELRLSASTAGHRKSSRNLLCFQSDIHESYSTFIETLIEQFAAISYGDLAYGRQIAVYLHPCVEASAQLSAWNALSNARVLELLPSLDNFIAKPEGYLEPPEEDGSLLEAYLKSWVTGALDRAVNRGSGAYTVALHHLSSFIFSRDSSEKLSLRNKIIKSLLRDYARKHQHEVMMLDLVRYNYPPNTHTSCQNEDLSSQMPLTERFQILLEACEGNSSLLPVVERLRSACRRDA